MRVRTLRNSSPRIGYQTKSTTARSRRKKAAWIIMDIHRMVNYEWISISMEIQAYSLISMYDEDSEGQTILVFADLSGWCCVFVSV